MPLSARVELRYRFVARAAKGTRQPVLHFCSTTPPPSPVERIGSNPFADGANNHVLRHDHAHMAVLAISAADLVDRRNHACPNRGGGALRNRVPLDGGSPSAASCVLICSTRVSTLPTSISRPSSGLDNSRMHGCGAPPVFPVPPVERHGEQDVRRLGAAVRNKSVVRRALEVRIPHWTRIPCRQAVRS